MTPAAKFLELVNRQKGRALEAAVADVARRNPQLALQVLEDIGSWPSSEPALRLLQRNW